jgi:hypothetical protein
LSKKIFYGQIFLNDDFAGTGIQATIFSGGGSKIIRNGTTVCKNCEKCPIGSKIIDFLLSKTVSGGKTNSAFSPDNLSKMRW